ncbi:ribosomal L7Ae/L30e/S12e/Gadd45 family protein [Tepidibacter aestuarii]|uniref:ribosomal L7Ae/L30e/S12e/Gadd45 family protein n=1 Tax=Tepidibacter aestuarii TaxID=2925782 RepID=UPI0020C0447D|nr:ribosomal L7Ae/L30e/S12e/Gadd45 family protein [Tepidibacter aestuarii]CAH2215231.1 K-turn RNA binding protein; alternative ribosomal protein L7A [Tepidibacter aestuarii]
MDLQSLKNEKKVIGTKQATRALKENKAKLVFIAQDAEKHVTKHVEELSKQNNVEIIYVDFMEELGRICNIQVGAAIVAVLK